MKNLILIAALIAGSTGAGAQNKSNFEMVTGNDKQEVIYTGEVTFEDIAQVKAFHLEEKSEQYEPDVQALDTLSDKLRAYQMIVFLGTWCEDSHKLIPELYRTLTDAGYPIDQQLQLYALDRDKKGRNGEERTYHITNVPTIILLQNGKEKGRITETVKKSIESDLLGIIGQK